MVSLSREVPKSHLQTVGGRGWGLQLIAECEEYHKAHLVTSPKKDDLVFKHVRGDGKHHIAEVNGLEEMVCQPGL